MTDDQGPDVHHEISFSGTCNDLNDCRTLYAIVSGCLATLVACTWASVHLNVLNPKPEDKYAHILHRLKLMVITLVAPEIIVLWAIRQRLVARNLSKEGFTMVHAFFVSMGGFVTLKEHGLAPVEPHLVGRGKTFEIEGIRNVIHDYEISDRSKGDEIAKGAAVFQTTWFIVQCIARKVQRLPLTELEIMTIAFASVNIAIYLIWWDKPLDVQYSVQIGPRAEVSVDTEDLHWGHLEGDREEKGVSWRARFSGQSWIEIMGSVYDAMMSPVLHLFVGEMDKQQLPAKTKRVPTLWAGGLSQAERGFAVQIATLLAVGFGAIHFAAWNVSFPSYAERVLWRVASITGTALPAFLFAYAFLLLRLQKSLRSKTQPEKSLPSWVQGLTYYLVMPAGSVIYIAARMLLMILPFASLRTLPDDVYKDVSWTNYIPHVA